MKDLPTKIVSCSQDVISLGPIHRTNMAFQFVQIPDDYDAKLVRIYSWVCYFNINLRRSDSCEAISTLIYEFSLTIPFIQVSLNTVFWLSTAANKLIYTPAGVTAHGKSGSGSSHSARQLKEQPIPESNHEENGDLSFSMKISLIQSFNNHWICSWFSVYENVFQTKIHIRRRWDRFQLRVADLRGAPQQIREPLFTRPEVTEIIALNEIFWISWSIR